MISIAKYVEGVEQIYAEQPEYELGHDGSDGKCDCIGMCKGAIRRAGGDASGLSGTNYAARNTIRDLRQISSAAELKVGDVVLKGRQPGDSGYALPDKYKDSGDLTDYYHIGTVTSTNPLVITHMTTPTAKQDTKLGKWAYAGWLPQVQEDSPEPGPEPDPPGPEPEPETATVTSENGKPVNLRRSPSVKAALVDWVPVGEIVTVLERGEEWSRIKWTWKTGYMMSRFLIFNDPQGIYSIFIEGLTHDEAEALHAAWPNSTIGVG